MAKALKPVQELTDENSRLTQWQHPKSIWRGAVWPKTELLMGTAQGFLELSTSLLISAKVKRGLQAGTEESLAAGALEHVTFNCDPTIFSADKWRQLRGFPAHFKEEKVSTL